MTSDTWLAAVAIMGGVLWALSGAMDRLQKHLDQRLTELEQKLDTTHGKEG